MKHCSGKQRSSRGKKPRATWNANTQKATVRPRCLRRQRAPEQAQFERYSWHPARKTRRVIANLAERLVVALNVAARKYHRTREEMIRICCEDWLTAKEGYQ